MAKTKPAKPQASGNGTIDIEHEVVQNAPLNAAAAAANPEEQIKIEIAKFTHRDAAIAQLKERFAGLTISGTDDKDGYKAVREAWGEVRTVRTSLEKKGLELRNRYKVITTAISKEEDRLIDLVVPLEEDLYKKWKAIDEEKDRVKREREEEEQRQAMIRVEEVMALGMKFNEGFYEIGDAISMDVATLRALPADKYEQLKKRIQDKAAEIKAAEEAEAERKRQERLKFEKEQAELKAEREKMDAERQKMEQERQQFEKERQEAAQRRIDNRTNALLSLGLVKQANGDLVYKVADCDDTVTVLSDAITDSSDGGFPILLKKTHEAIDDVNRRAELFRQQKLEAAEAKAKKEKLIADTLEGAGLSFNYGKQQFEFEGLGMKIIGTFDMLRDKTDEEIKAFGAEVAEDVKKQRVAMAKKEQADREEQKKQEQASLSDAERFSALILLHAEHAGFIDPAAYKTKKYQQRAQDFKSRIINLVNEFKP